MSNRVILVTGANGGLGLAIARKFLEASRDDRVALGIRNHRDSADSLASQFPGRAHVQPLDVTSPEDWKKCHDDIVKRYGRLDVLVNNAGTHDDSLLAVMKPSSWHRILDTNLHSVFHGCQAVLPTMISQRHGRIINMSSLSALHAPPGQTNYAAAKAGVVALTQSLAKEVARIGITVNAICPGYIETEALSGMPETERQTAATRVPMRRFGRPAEVAAAVHFLACSDAGYITGSVLKIDGGLL